MSGGAASAVIRSVGFHARRDPEHECLVDLRPGERPRRLSYAQLWRVRTQPPSIAWFLMHVLAE